MIGIDLVNLQDPLLKQRDDRALRLISNPNDHCPEHPLKFWLLWTAKEAIFKVHRQNQPFSPTAISVQITFDFDEILFSSKDISGKIIIESHLVIAICSINGVTPAYQVQKTEDPNLSLAVRIAIQQYFLNKHAQTVTVEQDTDDLPILSPLNLPVSFTHHSGFVGFCWPV